MTDPFLSRPRIACEAEAAAREFIRTGAKPACPYGENSDAGLAWNASLNRWLLVLSAPESEGGA